MLVTRVWPQDQDMWVLKRQAPPRVGMEGNQRGLGHAREDTQTVGDEAQEAGSRPANSACEQHTLLEASMNSTPLYVMDRMMVGIFFMCSVDFYREQGVAL